MINKVTRYSKRLLEEMKATARIARYTSLRKGCATFVAKLGIQYSIRNDYVETDRLKKYLRIKHKVMMEYFRKTFHQFESTYDYKKAVRENDPGLKNRIWVCWWQGLDNAPDIVKQCVKSIQNNAPNYTVTVITDDNYREFADIPAWIEEKYKKGIIPKAHFSDILRLSLLADHGGMWLDATTWCVSDEIEKYLQLPIWSVKRPGYGHLSVAAGNFANYALACDYDHRWVFAIIRDYVLYYWENNDSLIDYLFLDYIIVLIQERDRRVKKLFRDILPNNPNNDLLLVHLKDIYDEKLWEQLKQDTSIFKLTWKAEYPLQIKGEDTFYGRLLDGSLR